MMRSSQFPAITDGGLLAPSCYETADWKGAFAASAKGGHYGIRFCLCDDRDQADTAIECAKHLGLIQSRPARKPGEHRRQRPQGKIDFRVHALWQHPRNVFGDAPTRDVGEPLYAARANR